MVKRVVDWEAIEREYRAGRLTLREIATNHGVSNGRIAQVAKQKEWPRDISAKVAEKAKEKLSKASLSRGVSKGALVSERDLVEHDSDILVALQLRERDDVKRLRDLSMKLLAELEATTDGGDLTEQLTAALQSGDQDALAKAARKMITLPSRTDTMRKLAETTERLFNLERRVYGIDETPQGGPQGGGVAVAMRMSLDELLIVAATGQKALPNG